jgi:hypothetical protein
MLIGSNLKSVGRHRFHGRRRPQPGSYASSTGSQDRTHDLLEPAPGARPFFPIDRGAPLSDFERIVDEYPVFRVA